VTRFRHTALLLIISTLAIAAGPSTKPTIDVEAIARTFPDGGGYNTKWAGTGTPEEIRFKDARILSKSENGTYCCGFTFAVVMNAAGDAGLLKDETVEQIKRFQKEWYGAVKDKDVAEKQCAVALGNLGIGKQVTPDEAQPATSSSSGAPKAATASSSSSGSSKTASASASPTAAARAPPTASATRPSTSRTAGSRRAKSIRTACTSDASCRTLKNVLPQTGHTWTQIETVFVCDFICVHLCPLCGRTVFP
jgi:hypothetical protein